MTCFDCKLLGVNACIAEKFAQILASPISKVLRFALNDIFDGFLIFLKLYFLTT